MKELKVLRHEEKNSVIQICAKNPEIQQIWEIVGALKDEKRQRQGLADLYRIRHIYRISHGILKLQYARRFKQTLWQCPECRDVTAAKKHRRCFRLQPSQSFQGLGSLDVIIRSAAEGWECRCFMFQVGPLDISHIFTGAVCSPFLRSEVEM